jgi:DNA-binding CsgD family transcriptional regulator
MARAINTLSTQIGTSRPDRGRCVPAIRTFFNAEIGVFVDWQPVGGDASALNQQHFFFSNLAAPLKAKFFGEVLPRCPVTHWVAENRQYPSATSLHQLVGHRGLGRCALYQDILRPSGQHDVLILALCHKGYTHANISLTRSAEQAPFSPEDIALGTVLAQTLMLTLLAAPTQTPERCEAALSPNPASSPNPVLSTRESEIVALIAEGRETVDIATTLGISQWTVKNHLQTIYQKLSLHNRAALTRWFFQQRR